MKIVPNNINRGFVQGIIANDVFSPTDKVSIVTLKVKDQRTNPKTGKRCIFFVQVTAFDELAERVRFECQKGQIAFFEYDCTTSRKTNEKGITKFYRNQVVRDFCVGGKIESNVAVPYINEGFLQGEFIGIKKMPKADDISELTIKANVDSNNKSYPAYPTFTVFGTLYRMIAENYKVGDSICIKFKVETDIKVKEDGEKIYYTRWVLTSVL